jgi:hypothetical protein
LELSIGCGADDVAVRIAPAEHERPFQMISQGGEKLLGRTCKSLESNLLFVFGKRKLDAADLAVIGKLDR